MVPNDFAKLVRASDGRMVVAYLDCPKDEPATQLVCRTVIDGQPCSLTFNYTIHSGSLAEESLARFDVSMADKVVRHFVMLKQGKFDEGV